MDATKNRACASPNTEVVVITGQQSLGSGRNVLRGTSLFCMSPVLAGTTGKNTASGSNCESMYNLGNDIWTSDLQERAQIIATARSYSTSWCLNLTVPWRGTDWSAMPSWKIILFYGTPPGILMGHHIHMPYTLRRTFEKVRRRLIFAQHVIWYTYGQFVYVQVSPYEVETPAHWNMIGRSVTAP